MEGNQRVGVPLYFFLPIFPILHRHTPHTASLIPHAMSQTHHTHTDAHKHAPTRIDDFPFSGRYSCSGTNSTQLSTINSTVGPLCSSSSDYHPLTHSFTPYTHIYIHIRTHIYTHTHTYLYTYTHIHAHTHKHIQTTLGPIRTTSSETNKPLPKPNPPFTRPRPRPCLQQPHICSTPRPIASQVRKHVQPRFGFPSLCPRPTFNANNRCASSLAESWSTFFLSSSLAPAFSSSCYGPYQTHDLTLDISSTVQSLPSPTIPRPWSFHLLYTSLHPSRSIG